MEDSDHRALAGTLGYLLIQTAKAHHDRARTLLAPLGLFNGQEILLMCLEQAGGQSQTVLAANLCIQPATLTKSLDRMERAGWSERRANPQDGRASQVYLTEQGRALCPAIAQAWQQLDAEAFGSLTPEEQSTLRLLLEKIRSSFLLLSMRERPG